MKTNINLFIIALFIEFSALQLSTVDTGTGGDRDNAKDHLSYCRKVTEACDQSEQKITEKKMAQETMTDTASCTSLAVVPYDEDKVLPHQKSERSFSIAGHDFRIEQNWHSLGVAAVVWDSAIVLAEYLSENHELVAGKRVLELGAGTGLAGIVAAALGAEVTLTERAEAMEHLSSTMRLNTADKDWKINSQVLDWTSNPTPSEFSGYDVILGADIIYIEETFQDLLRTLTSVTSSSDKMINFIDTSLRSLGSKENSDHLTEKGSFRKDEIPVDGSKNMHSDNYETVLSENKYTLHGEDTHSKSTHKNTLYSSRSDCLVLLSCRIRYARDLKFLDLLREFFTLEEILHDKAREIKVFAARRRS